MADNQLFVDHYEVLGVKYPATQDEIKAAFRKLSLLYHPDKAGSSKDAHDRFIAISGAYDILKDADSKREYDLTYQTFRLGSRAGTTGMNQDDDFEAAWDFTTPFARSTDEAATPQKKKKRRKNSKRKESPEPPPSVLNDRVDNMRYFEAKDMLKTISQDAQTVNRDLRDFVSVSEADQFLNSVIGKSLFQVQLRLKELDRKIARMQLDIKQYSTENWGAGNNFTLVQGLRRTWRVVRDVTTQMEKLQEHTAVLVAKNEKPGSQARFHLAQMEQDLTKWADETNGTRWKWSFSF